MSEPNLALLYNLNLGLVTMHPTGLQQKRVCTSLGSSWPPYFLSNMCTPKSMTKQGKFFLQLQPAWAPDCAHADWGQEEPKLVYTLFRYKPASDHLI